MTLFIGSFSLQHSIVSGLHSECSRKLNPVVWGNMFLSPESSSGVKKGAGFQRPVHLKELFKRFESFMTVLETILSYYLKNFS